VDIRSYRSSHSSNNCLRWAFTTRVDLHGTTCCSANKVFLSYFGNHGHILLGPVTEEYGYAYNVLCRLDHGSRHRYQVLLMRYMECACSRILPWHDWLGPSYSEPASKSGSQTRGPKRAPKEDPEWLSQYGPERGPEDDSGCKIGIPVLYRLSVVSSNLPSNLIQ
jgi:hypothetical protein